MSRNGNVEQERYRQAVSYQKIMDSAVDRKNAKRDSIYTDAMREQFGEEALLKETSIRKSLDSAAQPSQHQFDSGGLGAPAVQRMMSMRRASVTISPPCSGSESGCSPSCSPGSPSPFGRPKSFDLPQHFGDLGLTSPDEPSQPSRFSLDAPRPPRLGNIGRPRRGSVDFVYEDGHYREITAVAEQECEDDGPKLSAASFRSSATRSRRASLDMSYSHLTVGSAGG